MVKKSFAMQNDDINMQEDAASTGLLNPISLFRSQFACGVASVDDCTQFMISIGAQDMNKLQGVIQELFVPAQTNDIIDENIFSAIYIAYFSSYQSSSVQKRVAHISSVSCDRCRRRYQMVSFINEKGKITRWCAICRQQKAIGKTSNSIFFRACIENTNFRLDSMRLYHQLNFKAASHLDLSLRVQYIVKLHDETKPNLRENDVTATFRKIIETAENYRYVTNERRPTGLSMLCSQSDEKAIGGERSQRHCTSIRTEKCRGTLNFAFKRHGILHITCYHEQLHEKTKVTATLCEGEQAFVCEKAEEGLFPFQICTLLRRNCASSFLWSQVYYRWSLFLESEYKRDKDPFFHYKSNLRQVRSSKNVFFSRAICYWFYD